MWMFAKRKEAEEMIDTPGLNRLEDEDYPSSARTLKEEVIDATKNIAHEEEISETIASMTEAELQRDLRFAWSEMHRLAKIARSM